MKFTVFEHGLKNAAWSSLWCLNPSTLVLPCLPPSCPSQTGSPQWLPRNLHCLRHSCPTLGLSDPPQHPSKFCLNKLLSQGLSPPIPFHSHRPPPKSPDLWLLPLLVPVNLISYHQEVVWNHMCMYLFLCLFTPELFTTAATEGYYTWNTLVWIVMC